MGRDNASGRIVNTSQGDAEGVESWDLNNIHRGNPRAKRIRCVACYVNSAKAEMLSSYKLGIQASKPIYSCCNDTCAK